MISDDSQVTVSDRHWEHFGEESTSNGEARGALLSAAIQFQLLCPPPHSPPPPPPPPTPSTFASPFFFFVLPQKLVEKISWNIFAQGAPICEEEEFGGMHMH